MFSRAPRRRAPASSALGGARTSENEEASTNSSHKTNETEAAGVRCVPRIVKISSDGDLVFYGDALSSDVRAHIRARINGRHALAQKIITHYI